MRYDVFSEWLHGRAVRVVLGLVVLSLAVRCPDSVAQESVFRLAGDARLVTESDEDGYFADSSAFGTQLSALAEDEAGAVSLAEALEPPKVPGLSSESDPLVRDLARRLADVESQLQARDKADQQKADAAAKKFAVRPFGRVHIDTGTFNQDQANKETVGEARNGVDIRRARLGVEGEGFDIFFYRFDVDFVTSDTGSNASLASGKRPTVFDAYVDTMQLPLFGNIRVGNFREPISLDRLESTNDMPFLERANPVNALTPFRNIGVMAFDWNAAETRTIAYGLFAENTNEYGEYYRDRPGVAITARTTWLPWTEQCGDDLNLVHLGLGYSFRHCSVRQAQFGTTPEFGIRQDFIGGLMQTPRFVNTPTIAMQDYHLFSLEFATDLGPFSLQSEYLMLSGNQIDNPHLFFHGGYIEAMYHLTGEHRSYNRKQGIHSPLRLNSNFSRKQTEDGIVTSPGAWELTGRISTIHLNSENIQGGDLVDLTIGLNWYYAPRSRVMINYIHAFLDRKNLDSNADIVGIRYQWVF